MPYFWAWKLSSLSQMLRNKFNSLKLDSIDSGSPPVLLLNQTWICLLLHSKANLLIYWGVVKQSVAFIVRLHTCSQGQLVLRRPELPGGFQESIFRRSGDCVLVSSCSSRLHLVGVFTSVKPLRKWAPYTFMEVLHKRAEAEDMGEGEAWEIRAQLRFLTATCGCLVTNGWPSAPLW